HRDPRRPGHGEAAGDREGRATRRDPGRGPVKPHGGQDGQADQAGPHEYPHVRRVVGHRSSRTLRTFPYTVFSFRRHPQDRQARIGPSVRYRTDRGNRSPSEIAMTVGVDRRVRRTRTNLTDAFIGLVLERGYERVTVQDILDRADVGRSTFYAH